MVAVIVDVAVTDAVAVRVAVLEGVVVAVPVRVGEGVDATDGDDVIRAVGVVVLGVDAVIVARRLASGVSVCAA